MEQNQNGLSQFGLSPESLNLIAHLEEQERQERLRLDVGTLNYIHGHLENYANYDLKITSLNIANILSKEYYITEDIYFNIIYETMLKEIMGIINLYDNIANEILDNMEEEQAGQPEPNPCDYPNNDGTFNCPFDSNGPDDCRRHCGLGVDE